MIGSGAVAALGSFQRKGLHRGWRLHRLRVSADRLRSIHLGAVSFAVAPILGFFTLFYMVGTNTLIQSTVPGELRDGWPASTVSFSSG